MPAWHLRFHIDVADKPESFDVAIIGGGLAGLTLALQLRQTAPSISILVLEKNSLPPPPAAHKVGEATVEIGAHYLAHTLGLKDRLEATQLRKFGLRLFFGSGHCQDLADADELGASSLLPAISYQLDRGILEKDLYDILIERGVEVRDRSRATNVAINTPPDRHQITVSGDDAEYAVLCRWLIDASSRSAVLKRQLGMTAASKHQMSAAWFRLDASISVDNWSDDKTWQARCNGLSRLPSTNHLMGSGYWAWIIPLVGGRSSIGLVSDPAIVPLSSYDSFEKFRAWLDNHQPLLAEQVNDQASALMDFRKLGKLAHGSQRVWSRDCWAMTGEAGVFADPFYSPGTDFIALSNTFITDLVTRRCSDAERGIRSSVYEKLYQSFFQSTMTLYQDQYGGFGDTRLMSIKLTWDYAYYWSILAWLYFREVLTELTFLRSAQQDILAIRALNDTMQARFRECAARRRVDRGAGRFIDQISIPLMLELNAALLEPAASPEKELGENCERLQRLAPMLLAMIDGRKAPLGANTLLGDLEARLA